MAKAAVELSISQPAVSKAIADMEHTLGVVLFDRLAQGVTPTPSGDALLKSAVAVFDDVRQGLQEIEFLADPTSGVLRIAAGEPMVAGLLPEILRRLHVRYPRLSIDVTMVPAISQHYRGLRDRHFDLTVGRLVDPMDDDMRAEILFNDQVYIVAGRTNAWCRRRKIELAELINEPWIIPPRDHLIGSLLATAFRAKGLEIPRAAVTTFSLQLSSALLRTGDYLTVLPSSMLQFNALHLNAKALPVRLPPAGDVGIVTLKNRTVSPAAKLFIQCAREVGRQLL